MGVKKLTGSSQIAKALRKRPTDAERLLWKHLRLKQLDGLKFRRQEPIDQFIVDFVCYEARVIIEADGGQHNKSTIDATRDAYLQSQGFKVLRFWNNDILSNIQGVMESIGRVCSEHSPSPAPPVKGGVQ